jgi:hypothetical protein
VLLVANGGELRIIAGLTYLAAAASSSASRRMASE